MTPFTPSGYRAPILRDYQLEALDRVRSAFSAGRTRVLLSLPTGAGKTVIAAHMIREARHKGRRVLFLAHRRELIDQASARLSDLDVPHGVILAGRPATDSEVQVASVQTLSRRDTGTFDFVYVDEAHHTTARTYLALLERVQARWVVGLTATPYRTDGRGLGQVYDALVQGPGTYELVGQGHLVPAEIWAPPSVDMTGARRVAGDWDPAEAEARANRPEIVGDVVSTWIAHHAGATVAFACSVAHAEALAAAFRAKSVRAVTITGETSPYDRADRLAALSRGAIDVVVNCSVLTEGWDCPAATCAVIARPTLSRGLWRQMAGRVLRQYPGKGRALILDHGGCTRRHGHLYEPDATSLDAGADPLATQKPPSTRICQVCFGVWYRRESDACPYCGRVQEVRQREVRRRAGELARVDWESAPHRGQSDEQARAVARNLEATAKARGYRPGWVWTQLRIRYGAERARRVMRG